MTLIMKVATTPGGSLSTVDLLDKAVAKIRLSVGYSHPRRLSWIHHKPSHTFPLGIRNFIQLFDTDYSADTPVFEGFIWEVNPVLSDANMVSCVAYDPTHMVGREIPIMSLPWVESGGGYDYGTGAIPRLVFNSKIDGDDDYAQERDHDLECGEIIGTILDDAEFPLRYWNAAPAVGAYYEPTDLANFTYKPQDKVVFESEQMLSAVQQMAGYHPAWKFIWMPGVRQWRWVNLYATDAVTVTLNQFDGDYEVLNADLRRSLDGRYPAVRFFGPQKTEINIYTTEDDSLEVIEDVNLQTYTDISGTHDAICPITVQIADAGLRRGARFLPEVVAAPMGSYNVTPTRSPNLQLSFDGDTWASILNPMIDFANGTASLVYPLYFYIDPPPVFGSDQNFFPPLHVRLVWANIVDGLQIRYPEEGFEGTSYSVAGMTAELVEYHEEMAVGYEWGVPVSTETRLEQMLLLAQARHEALKDIVYTGGMTFRGLVYTFLNLNKAINIAAVDGDGDELVTGWEDIGAIITDVEYDYENDITLVTFSSDQMELVNEDPELLKHKLRIGATQRLEETLTYIDIRWNDNSFVYSQTNIYYLDEGTGNIDKPIF